MSAQTPALIYKNLPLLIRAVMSERRVLRYIRDRKLVIDASRVAVLHFSQKYASDSGGAMQAESVLIKLQQAAELIDTEELVRRLSGKIWSLLSGVFTLSVTTGWGIVFVPDNWKSITLFISLCFVFVVIYQTLRKQIKNRFRTEKAAVFSDFMIQGVLASLVVLYLPVFRNNIWFIAFGIIPIIGYLGSVLSLLITFIQNPLLLSAIRKKKPVLPRIRAAVYLIRTWRVYELKLQKQKYDMFSEFYLTELAAQTVEQEFSKVNHIHDAHIEKWYSKTCTEAANGLRELKKQFLLPDPDTHKLMPEKLYVLSASLMVAQLQPFLGITDRISVKWHTRLLRIVRIASVAAIPLVITLLHNSSVLLPEIPQIREWGLIVSIGWIAVNILTLLDKGFGEKMENARSLLGIFKG